MQETRKQFNGHAFLVAVLRQTDPQFRKKLEKILAGRFPLIVRLAEEFAFIYEDLNRLDDKGLQLALRSADEQSWLVSFKLTSEKMRARLLRNMSPSRREDFAAAFAVLPRMPRRQVVRMQMEIARKVQALIEGGKIALHKRPQ